MRKHGISLGSASLAIAMLFALTWTFLAPPASADVPHNGSPKEGEVAAEPRSAEERTKILEGLYARLAAAPSAEEAEPLVLAIQRLWRYSGSATADLLLERAIALSKESRLDLALTLMDTIVELQPNYAEAWTQRALLHYLKSDYQRALGDLRRALALEPNHFMALDGLARILREIGEKKGALAAFQGLLAVHPNALGARAAVEELRNEVEGQGI